MLPYIHIFGMHIPMYSVMLAIGLIAFFILYFRAFRTEFRTDRVTFNRLTFSVCLSIGALLLFAFLFDGIFHSIEKGELSFGGITWLGGVAGAFPAVLILTHVLVPKKKGYELDTLDSIIPGLALAHGFGRLGCFFGGCCFGKVTASPLGVVFPEGSIAQKLYPNPYAEGSLPVLPTQLYEAGFEFILFAVLLILSRKSTKYNTAVWSVSYAVFRFIFEFFRGDSRGSTGFFFTPAQLLSVLLLTFGILIILLRKGVILRNLSAKLSSWQEKADSLSVIPIDLVKNKLSATDTLRELHKLKEEGIISEAEYEKKKSEILERM